MRKGARIMVALSGGPDSVATLLVLESLRERLGIELLAIHFDHQLRPDSSADLEWCRELCKARDIAFYSGEGEVARRAAEAGKGIEAAARDMRYQFIGFVAGKERVERVVTGHTADDQAETILMRILRGSGVRGIRGMLPLAPLPGSPGLTLIRPLLRISRAETVALCREAGIEPRIDTTNTDIAYQRNRIRVEILPALRDLTPGLDRALIGLGESAREAFAPIEKESMGVQPSERGALGSIFRLKPLAALPAEALTLLIEREATFFKLPAEVNRTRIKNLRAVLRKGAGEVSLGEVVVQVSCGLARLGPPLAWDDASVADSRVMNVPGSTKLNEWRVDVASNPLPELPGAWTAAIDMSATKGVLRLRTATPGDVIRTAAGHKKLGEWLIDRKIPAWQRHGMVVIADASGVHAILGMPPFGGLPAEENAFYLRATKV